MKVPRIGYLSVSSLSDMADRIDAFRDGLRELGYVEGKNIVIEWRYGQEKPDRVSELAAELARLKVDVIVSGGNSATQAVKKATKHHPHSYEAE
jgi:putative tryptophan/tyrosine transport system substrate-binding protein